MELFLLPPRMREVERCLEARLHPQGSRSESVHKELGRAVENLIRLQRPEFEGIVCGLEPIRTHEGRAAYLASYRGRKPPFLLDYEGALCRGLSFIAIDRRGRIFGEAFEVPPWDNAMEVSQMYGKAAAPESEPEVLQVCSDAHYSLSVDARGIVPRGARPNVNFTGRFGDPMQIHVSSGGSEVVRIWLASLSPSSAHPERIQLWLSSPHTADRFRALHEIERLGPKASRLAIRLLGHPDPELRACAAAVVANDLSLWREILPLVSDASSLVSLTARCALLRGPDIETARKTLADLLRMNPDYFEILEFDEHRLLSHEAAGALLDALGSNESDDLWRFWNGVRAEHLQPVKSRLVDLWSTGPTHALAVWLVRVDDPGLDRLLEKEIQAEPEDPDDFFTARNRVAEAILGELVHRPRPLEGEKGLAAVRLYAKNVSSLNAHLVLARWKEPGAVEALLEKLREPENDWLFQPVWERSLPSDLVEGLTALAKENPERYADRVREILGSAK
jgi:hypothetical protein